MSASSNKKESDSEKIGERVTIYRRGQQWYARYSLNRKQHRERLKTCSRKHARMLAGRLDASIAAGEHRPPTKDVGIAALCGRYEAYLEAEGKAPKTLLKVKQVARQVMELAARRKVASVRDLDLSFVDAYRGELAAAGKKPKTILNHTVIIRQMVNFARMRKLVVDDPLAGLKLKKVRSQEQPCWTREQVLKILDAADGWQRDALTVLAETGMRVGEAKWLTWDDVDFDRGVVQVRPKDGWQTKTGNQRAIPMSEKLSTTLHGLRRHGRWVLRTAKPNSKAAEGQISERTLLTYLKRVLKRLGLPGHLHTFRHSFISHALISGVPEATVRKWVGHVDADILQTYTHINDQASQAAMARLSGAVEAENSTESSRPLP